MTTEATPREVGSHAGLGPRIPKPKTAGRYTWVAPEVGPLPVEVAREGGRLLVFHDATEIAALSKAKGGDWHSTQRA